MLDKHGYRTSWAVGRVWGGPARSSILNFKVKNWQNGGSLSTTVRGVLTILFAAANNYSGEEIGRDCSYESVILLLSIVWDLRSAAEHCSLPLYGTWEGVRVSKGQTHGELCIQSHRKAGICAVLWFVLCCFVLFCSVLCCDALWCAVVFFVLWFVLCCDVLFCTVLWFVLCCVLLFCSVLCCFVLCCVVLC